MLNYHFVGLVQNYSNSIANALEILQSCTWLWFSSQLDIKCVLDVMIESACLSDIFVHLLGCSMQLFVDFLSVSGNSVSRGENIR